MDRRIDTVKLLTRGWGIESFAALGSDQTAAEALQEAETAVGLGVTVVIGAKGAMRASGSSYRSARPVIDVGLVLRFSRFVPVHLQEISMQLVEGWRSWELRWRK